MISDAALAQLKHDNPCDAIASRWVRLRKHGTKMVGPCPVCSRDRQDKSATRFEATNESWVCAVCRDGGDVIKLVQLVEAQDFRGAVAWLGGPGEVDTEAVARREHERAEQRAKRDAEADRYRQDERKRFYRVWNQALPAEGTPVEAYLRHRGLELPVGARLRYVVMLPFFHGEEIGEDGRKHARIIHRGPAMVTPIIDNAGKFRGLHRTWVDVTQPKGRAVITDPDTGEVESSRKYGGRTQAAHVELLGPRAPRQIIIGEGIETTLTAWLALSKLGRDISSTAFWTALDLGNFGGKAADRVGRVPGPTPDLSSPAIALPDCVEDVVLLGDGDSDPKLTECALRRAAARWATPTRQARVAWAPAGRDFNDLLAA